MVESAAGIILLFLAIALFLAFVKGGMPGVANWLRAKFVGEAA